MSVPQDIKTVDKVQEVFTFGSCDVEATHQQIQVKEISEKNKD